MTKSKTEKLKDEYNKKKNLLEKRFSVEIEELSKIELYYAEIDNNIRERDLSELGINNKILKLWNELCKLRHKVDLNFSIENRYFDHPFSEIEYNVIMLIAKGLPSESIAKELKYSVYTINDYKTKIVNKVNLDNCLLDCLVYEDNDKINQIHTICKVYEKIKTLSQLNYIELKAIYDDYCLKRSDFEKEYKNELIKIEIFEEKKKKDFEQNIKDFEEAENKFYKNNLEFYNSVAEIYNLSYNLMLDKDKITDSEIEIIKLIYNGHTNQKISKALNIPVKTVVDKKNNIVNKICNSDRLKMHYVKGNQLKSILNAAPFILTRNFLIENGAKRNILAENTYQI